MPNIKSAIKRVDVTRAKTRINRQKKSEIRTIVKKALEATCAETKADNAAELVRTAQASLDRAAAGGLIHKNTAARKKSRLQRRLNTVE